MQHQVGHCLHKTHQMASTGPSRTIQVFWFLFLAALQEQPEEGTGLDVRACCDMLFQSWQELLLCGLIMHKQLGH